MKHHVLSAAAAVLMFTAPVAVQAQDVTLSRIEVQTDLSAYEGSNASEFWPSLEADLGRAIASVVTVDETAPAPAIRVEINKIAISGSPILPDTGEFNEMEGTVAVFRGLEEDVTSGSQEDATPNEIERSFPIKVSAVTGEAIVPEGYIAIPPSDGDFYAAMIGGFALETVERLDE
ncbi:hypothetical protein [Roseovarius sp.]|jgi:hypothetical protein|uniref:hypothetical protein n=1 Tax=Roseovarius sp. TaxID=1486281 RepID=UPI002627DA09|nr:hypothetical protein [Roseovarius sp.]MDM8164457.1 hypothetical protein [Roseovarius sp.]